MERWTSPRKMYPDGSGDRGIQAERFSLALKQASKQLADSDTFCGFHGRNISTYRESLVPGIPTTWPVHNARV